MRFMLSEFDVWMIPFRFEVECSLLLELLFVRRDGVELSVDAQEFHLLPLELFAGGVEAGVSLPMERPGVRLAEEVAHLFLQVGVGVVDMIDHLIEVSLAPEVPVGRAFFLFRVGVIKVLVHGALDLVRDALECIDVDAWLVILLTEAGVELEQNALGCVLWILDLMDLT